jgi:Ca2+-binding EF-hand superfamily protein
LGDLVNDPPPKIGADALMEAVRKRIEMKSKRSNFLPTGFSHFDEDNDGYITLKEFAQVNASILPLRTSQHTALVHIFTVESRQANHSFPDGIGQTDVSRPDQSECTI